MTLQQLNRKLKPFVVFLAIAAVFFMLHCQISGNIPIAEHVYGRKVYPIIHNILSFVTGLLPFSTAYALVALLLAWLVYRTSRRKRRSFKLTRFIIRVLYFTLFIIASFYLLWGWNYSRQSIESNLGFEKTNPTPEEVQSEFDSCSRAISRLLESPFFDSLKFGDYKSTYHWQSHHNILRSELNAYLGPTYADITNNPVRALAPRGLLQGFGASGIYFPFTSESNFDPGLHPLIIPFVVAHELAHAAGVTDEGACNFVAYKACSNSEDLYLNYVGLLNYWRYLGGHVKRRNPDYFDVTWKQMPAQFRTDLIDIRDQFKKYPDYIPAIRKWTYDRYLKAQGIKEGLANYQAIIVLVWSEKQNSNLKDL